MAWSSAEKVSWAPFFTSLSTDTVYRHMVLPVPASTLDMGNGTEPLAASVGSLNLREDVLQGLLEVREEHNALEGILHQVMRKVVLPRAYAIGLKLDNLKALYPKGRKGPGGSASRFYRDCEVVTGLKKAQVANYVQLANNWHRLMDYMADMPEGARPIQSLKGALEAIRAMNRPLRPAGAVGSIDAEATTVSSDALAPSLPITATMRKKVVPTLISAKALSGISDKLRQQLEKLAEAADLVFDQIEADLARQRRLEEGRPVPPPSEWELEEPDLKPELYRPLLAEYPNTLEGYQLMAQRLVEAGSGPAFFKAEAKRLNVAVENVRRHWKRRQRDFGQPTE